MNMDTNDRKDLINQIPTKTNETCPGTLQAGIEIPLVPNSKIDDETIKRVNAMIHLVETSHVTSSDGMTSKEAFNIASRESGIAVPTLHWYCTQLRQLFNLPKRAPLATIANHPQLHQALEFLLTRKERSDRLSLQSAKGLSILVPTTGEIISVEAHLKSLYPRPSVDAKACSEALRARCLQKQLLQADGSVATLADLPSERSVTRFLQHWREEYVAVRMGRARKHDFETQELGYVTRNPEDWAPGEHWFGDHTEHPFELYNEESGQIEHWWVTAWIDLRTGLMLGWHHAKTPSSQTIALAFRNAYLGSQLKVAVQGEAGIEYRDPHISNMPKEITIDRGKDYLSRDTKRLFGKIDFDDAARRSLDRITHLNYALPYHAQTKGMIEVWFKTYQAILKYLPGFRGSNYGKKPDSNREDLKSNNILTVATFQKMFALAVHAYNNRVKRRLGKQTPLQCYLANQAAQRSYDPRVLDFLMFKSKPRKIERQQISIFSTEYYSEALLPFNSKFADVYYDPMDLGFVSLYVDGEWAAVASNKEMMGQSERGWLKIIGARKHQMSEMGQQLKTWKRGVSDVDARYQLLEARLMNVEPVSAEALALAPQNVTLLTGLEARATEHAEELQREKNLVEVMKRSRKRGTSTGLSIAAVNERIR
jgi:transposase InsO family protein